MEFSSTKRIVLRSQGPSKPQFCMICLDTSVGCKLYPANTYSLGLEFEQLTGISLQGDMHFVPEFCAGCAQRLSNCCKFRDKCKRAYHLLLQLVEIHKPLTTQNIETLNISHNLASGIGKKSFQPDHCDLYLIHKKQETKIQQESPNNITLKKEVKSNTANLILKRVPRNEKNIGNEVLEPKTENLNDIQTDDLEDIDKGDYDKINLPNNKTIKMEVESVNSKLILNPDVENQVQVKNDLVELKMEKDYVQTDDLRDIDIDIKRDERVKHKDVYMNNVINDTNNCIYLEDTDSFLESGVNDKADDIKNVKVTHVDSKFKVIGKRTLKPKMVRKSKKPVKIENQTNNYLESGVVNNKADTKNVKVSPDSKIKVIRKSRKVKKSKKPEKIEDQEFSKQFKVTEMSHAEQLVDLQKRKETANFQNSFYKCVECFKGFRSGNVYNTHMDKHTDKFGKVVCLVCGLHYLTQHKLNEHVSRVHRVKYSCTSCSLATSHKMAAINHQNWHNGVIYTCPYCQEKRRSKTGYLSHLRIMHPTDVVCPVCGFSFLNQKGLGLHVKRKHRDHDVGNPAGPLCEPCNIRFASETAYQQHMQVSLKHAAGKLLKRNTPKQNYTRADKTEDELNSETKVLSCEQCGVQLHGFRSYNHHFKTHHPGEARAQHPPHRTNPASAQCLCEKCGHSFLTPYTLKFHMTSKHSGKKEFQCDVCQKTFFLKRHLVLHAKTHSGDQLLHQCPVCQKQFNLRANCKRHMWTHKTRKPHACATCDRSFADAAALRSHVRHHHYKTPYPKKRRALV